MDGRTDGWMVLVPMLAHVFVLVQKASAVVMVVPLLVPMRVLVPVLMNVRLHINLFTN